MALSDDQLRALGLIGPKPSAAPTAGTTTTTPADTGVAATSTGNISMPTLAAFTGGAYKGGVDVLNTPSAWLGAKPIADPNAPLSPEEQAAIAQHPWAAGIGRTVGQIAATLPAMAELPVIGGTGLVANMLRGAGYGAVQNALTAGETLQPSGQTTENLGERVLRGAKWGAVAGPIAEKIGGALGLGETISPTVQNAGKTLQDAGVDITEANLPRAGGTAGARGAAATDAQVQQLNTALSKTFGQDKPDFSPGNVSAMENAIGPRINAAAARGQIDPSSPGSTFTSDLADAETAARDPGNIIDPTHRAALLAHIQQIRNAMTAHGGVIPGAQFDSLTGAGSKIARWSGTPPPTAGPDFEGVVDKLDDALRNGFKASSPADAYGDWVNERTNYRLLQAVKNNLDPSGNVKPATLYQAILRKFPNIRSMPSSAGNAVTQARDLAAAANTAFGGPAAAAAPAGSLGRDVISYGGLGGLAGYGAHLAFPSLVANPLIGVPAAALPILARLGQGAGAAWRGSPMFLRNLLTHGSPLPLNYNALLTGGGITAGQPSQPGYR